MTAREDEPLSARDSTVAQTWPRNDDLRTAHAVSTRLPLSLTASGEASVPAILAAGSMT